MRLDVPVQFSGVVSVLVPDHLSASDRNLLAEKVALARILATCDNPDAPEDDASCDYAEQCSDTAQVTAEQDWDQCEIHSVSGTWLLKPQ